MLKYLKTKPVKDPEFGTEGSAGIDLFIPDNFTPEWIEPGSDLNIPSGLKFNIPKGHALIAFNKSGVATKLNLAVGACVIDSDYQGECHLHVYNWGTERQLLQPGQKLMQVVMVPVCHPVLEECHDESILFGGETTQRGNGGFGSTGNGLS